MTVAKGGWDGEANRLGCAWWSRLDGRWLVEVQYDVPPGPTGKLCVFDKMRDFALLHEEPTAIIEGARFGPDVDDVARWQLRCMEIVDGHREAT